MECRASGPQPSTLKGSTFFSFGGGGVRDGRVSIWGQARRSPHRNKGQGLGRLGSGEGCCEQAWISQRHLSNDGTAACLVGIALWTQYVCTQCTQNTTTSRKPKRVHISKATINTEPKSAKYRQAVQSLGLAAQGFGLLEEEELGGQF